ncbi:MAG: transposase [Spongiibacteraceae bacterium]|nr:transposase [Spongiibacteraceae bacterium]
MVVMDPFSRKIVGFAVCCMFNSMIGEQLKIPKYLSTDNDSLFLFHQWKANLRVLNIKEIKSVPYVTESHPFIERVVGSVRREFLDHTLFWNKSDLENKLNQYQEYYNNTRGHWSLDHSTSNQQGESQKRPVQGNDMNVFSWQSHCNGLFQTPVMA